MAVESEFLELGTRLIPFSLRDTEGKIVSSDSFADSPLLLVVFICNHCPYAVASWPVLIELQKKYGDSGYRSVAINPNNNPEYPEDSFERMKPFAEKIGVNFPYLFDADQNTARAYRAACTPDPYLFHNGKLLYHGRINDNWKDPSQVKEKSLELQILSVLGKENAPQKAYPSMGCSIKWVS